MKTFLVFCIFVGIALVTVIPAMWTAFQIRRHTHKNTFAGRTKAEWLRQSRFVCCEHDEECERRGVPCDAWTPRFFDRVINIPPKRVQESSGPYPFVTNRHDAEIVLRDRLYVQPPAPINYCCGVCGSHDPNHYMRCDHPGCMDGRDR